MENTNTWGGAREGAGRPAIYAGKMERVTMRLPQRLLAKLDRTAAARGLTRSQVATAALRDMLK